jgi:hypothetical protein
MKKHEKSGFSVSKSGFLKKIKIFFVVMVVCNELGIMFVSLNLKKNTYGEIKKSCC